MPVHQIQNHPKPRQSSTVLVLTLRLLPTPSSKLRMLVTLFSPNHLKTHTHTHRRRRRRRREEKSWEAERGWGEKGGRAGRSREVIFFSPSTLLLFSHLPLCPYLFLCPSSPPLLPSLLISVSRLLNGKRLGVSTVACVSTIRPPKLPHLLLCIYIHASSESDQTKGE